MKYPALDVVGVDADLLEALVDDFSPTAAEQRDHRTTIFFADVSSRTRARDAIADTWPAASLETRDVDDEDWARRSQENLTPITVGRITITPPWHVSSPTSPQSRALGTESPVPSSGSGFPSLASQANSQPPAYRFDSQALGLEPPAPGPRPITLVITPSMGFGTGHHATTRLCLGALQAIDLTDRLLLDVGTGSGVLAIAGRALGARHAVGIDYDVDAIQAAAANLEANPGINAVELVVGDLRTSALTPADVVTANLTGALLVQSATRLLAAIRPGGMLIVSGLLAHERADVVAAFSHAARLAWEDEEQGWLGLVFNVKGVDTV